MNQRLAQKRSWLIVVPIQYHLNGYIVKSLICKCWFTILISSFSIAQKNSKGSKIVQI